MKSPTPALAEGDPKACELLEPSPTSMHFFLSLQNVVKRQKAQIFSSQRFSASCWVRISFPQQFQVRVAAVATCICMLHLLVACICLVRPAYLLLMEGLYITGIAFFLALRQNLDKERQEELWDTWAVLRPQLGSPRCILRSGSSWTCWRYIMVYLSGILEGYFEIFVCVYLE